MANALGALPSQKKITKRGPRHQELDELCKQAMETDGARLLALVLTPAVCRRIGLPHGPLRLLEILPTELRRKRQHADYLIKVAIGERVFLLHVEFQNRTEKRMALRVVQYQVAVVAKYELPVYSVVFNVKSTASQAALVQDLGWGGLRSQWVEVTVPRAVKLWGRGKALVSPLAVLLATLLGGLSDEELEQCRDRLRELGLDDQTCRDLMEALCFLIDIKDGRSHAETGKRLFMKMRIKQTWLYHEGRQEGVKEGVKEGVETMQQTAIELCEQRFGRKPDRQSLRRIRQLREPSLLSRLIVRLATAASLPEALSALPAA